MMDSFVTITQLQWVSIYCPYFSNFSHSPLPGDIWGGACLFPESYAAASCSRKSQPTSEGSGSTFINATLADVFQKVPKPWKRSACPPAWCILCHCALKCWSHEEGVLRASHSFPTSSRDLGRAGTMCEGCHFRSQQHMMCSPLSVCLLGCPTGPGRAASSRIWPAPQAQHPALTRHSGRRCRPPGSSTNQGFTVRPKSSLGDS